MPILPNGYDCSIYHNLILQKRFEYVYFYYVSRVTKNTFALLRNQNPVH